MTSSASSEGEGCATTPASYSELSYEEIDSKAPLGEYTHASHVMLYAEWPGVFMGKYPFHYAIMVSKSLLEEVRLCTISTI